MVSNGHSHSCSTSGCMRVLEKSREPVARHRHMPHTSDMSVFYHTVNALPERGQTRLLNFSVVQVEITREKACVEEALTNYFDAKQSMNSKSHANKHKLVTFLIPEHRQAKDYYAKDYKRSCFDSEIKGRNS